MINGRISTRSYPRYKLVRPLFRRVLADVDRFCMQSEESAHRLIALGADPSRVTVTGSLKFDSLELPAPTAAHGKPRERVLRFFRISAHRTVSWPAARCAAKPGAARSRKATQTRHHHSAPRAPSGSAVEASRAGFVTARDRAFHRRRAARRRHRARLDPGELAQLYQLATVVFVGEPGRPRRWHPRTGDLGKPILFGPHMRLREIVRRSPAIAPRFRSLRTASRRSDSPLVRDPVHRAGRGGGALVEANRGAKRRRSPSSATAAAARQAARPSVPAGAVKGLVELAHALGTGARSPRGGGCAASDRRQARSRHQRRQSSRRRQRPKRHRGHLARVLATRASPRFCRGLRTQIGSSSPTVVSTASRSVCVDTAGDGR